MEKVLSCKRCRKDFEGWQNAEYCPSCKPIRKRERERLAESKRKGKPVAEGKWRCPICGCFKDKQAQVCINCHNARKHGDRVWNWKGGRVKQSDGYIYILKPKGYEERKHRYILEHRYIWEQAHGKLPEGYIIHHLNSIKDDNRLENLAALPRTAHSGLAVLSVFNARIRELELQIRAFQSTSLA